MKNGFYIILFISFVSFGQTGEKLVTVASLPSIMEEVSGIEQPTGSDLLWMINDSGNAAEVYGYSLTEQKITRILVSPRMENDDWEDLTSDGQGNLYVGDFGNNRNNRENLAIYKLSGIHTDSLHTSITRFQYEDQTKFPPKKKDRNFDVEAFFYLNDHFYLFTRNRSSKFDGTTKLYKVPAKSGVFVAKHIGTFTTCEDENDCQVTSAAINPSTGTIALLSYDKVWLFSDYKEDSFFGGRIVKIKLGHDSQKESITFLNDETLLIADERNGNEGGNLYSLKIK